MGTVSKMKYSSSTIRYRARQRGSYATVYPDNVQVGRDMVSAASNVAIVFVCFVLY